MNQQDYQAGRIADRLAIADILHQHSRGLDRSDAALIRDCYWPDAELDYGVYKGPAQPFADLVVGVLTDTYELTRHCISNTMLTFEGDRAHAESYVDANHLFPGGEQELRVGSRYLDLLEQREGQWRILHRQVVIDWSQASDFPDERNSEAFGAFVKGRNDDSDPLHAFLGGA
jgi:SnoaL-like domain